MGAIKDSIESFLTEAKTGLRSGFESSDHNFALIFSSLAVKNYAQEVFGGEGTAESIHLFSEENDDLYRNSMNFFSDEFQIHAPFLINDYQVGNIPLANGIPMVEDDKSFEYLMQVIYNVKESIHTLTNNLSVRDSRGIINTAAVLMYDIADKCIDLEKV